MYPATTAAAEMAVAVVVLQEEEAAMVWVCLGLLRAAIGQTPRIGMHGLP